MAIQIPEGYELLTGRGREGAIAALKEAEDRGLDPQVVLTHPEGYLVPIVGEAEVATLEELTVDELKAEAKRLEIDLGGATKKADIIAAIEASDKVPVLGAANEGE